MSEVFYRIAENEIWGARAPDDHGPLGWYTVLPYLEIVGSKAPHLVINKPFRSITIPAYGKHVLVPQEVYDIVLVWMASPGYAGMNMQETLDAAFG